jgi:hypothetical protein
MEIGNDTPALWRAIEDLAKLCKSLDPNHPVMTVVADMTPQKIANIKTLAPSVDIIGFNSYGGLPTLPKRLKDAGWEKPFIVTEFGPMGPWESPKTTWGAAIEKTSTEKAEFYRSNVEKSIAASKGWCLGAYAFLWGDKQEETPTWFGMFLPTGERTEAVDVMSEYWSGRPPRNRVPKIAGFHLDIAQKEVPPGSRAKAAVRVSDAEMDPISFRWEVRREAVNKGYAGQGEVRPGVVSGLLSGIGTSTVEFDVPRDPGAYRVYVVAADGKGGAACVNQPFLVKAP